MEETYGKVVDLIHLITPMIFGVLAVREPIFGWLYSKNPYTDGIESTRQPPLIIPPSLDKQFVVVNISNRWRTKLSEEVNKKTL